jgi:hypothetical protein
MRVIGNAVRFPPISSTGRRRRNRSEIRFQPNCLLVVVASLSVYSSFSLAFCFLPCARSESIFPTILLPPPTPAGRSSRNKPGLVSSLLPGGRFSATERNRREAPRASPVVGVKRRCRLLLPLRGRRRQCGGQGRGRNGVEAAIFLSSVLNLRRKMAIESASQSIVARLRVVLQVVRVLVLLPPAGHADLKMIPGIAALKGTPVFSVFRRKVRSECTRD